jgi:hypothetical protein
MIKYKELFDAYFFHIATYVYFGYLLVCNERSWHASGTGLFMCTIFYWLGHRAQHQLPTDGIWKYINLHPAMHHYKKIKVSRPIELVLEFIYEVFICLLFPIVIQLLSGDWIIPLSIIIYFALFFALNHVVYYSILHSDVHEKHHKNVEINFIPDYFDHLFGRNADSHYEDMNQQIPLLVMAALATHLLKLYFQWKD